MNNLLIIYPHWHPANLAGVHRPRLSGNFLKDFGWKPIVLTVHEKYYEEGPDLDFVKTFSEDFEVYRVGAFPITRPRIFGDIGLRAFFHLYWGALKLIRSYSIDFIWIPIPSFYTALLGRLIYSKTNVPYGIDYIDPWVRDISSRNDWRHRLSNLAARILEPIAVKKASLITGVSYEYYKPVLERNFLMSELSKLNCEKKNTSPETGSPLTPHNSSFTLHHTAFPYGFDPNDHKIKLAGITYPWSDQKEIVPWLYAGAFLPNSRLFIKLLFEGIRELRYEGQWNEKIRLYFIGTGSYPGKTIKSYAEDTGVSDIVIEDRSRYPYLHILNFLSAAHTVMVIGSTEKHYTASKLYQALLSERPVWAVFHEESSALKVLKEVHADTFSIGWNENINDDIFRDSIRIKLVEFLNYKGNWSPNLELLNARYSSRVSAEKLTTIIEEVLLLKELN